MTQLRLIRWSDLRLQKISRRRYLALGAAWLEALSSHRDAVLRRWPTTDHLVLEDPIDDDDLSDASVIAARLVDLARASVETTTAGDGSGQRDKAAKARNERLTEQQPGRRATIGDASL